MANICSNKYNFLCPQDIRDIEENLKTDLRECYQSVYKDFVPLVVESIDKKCKNFFSEIQTSAENGDFYCLLTPFFISKGLNKVILNCFNRIHGLQITRINTGGFSENSINNQIFPTVESFRFQCVWSPCLLSKTKEKRYQFDPTLNTKALYVFAKNATDTDVTLMSSDGEKIPAHKLILKLKSSYFKTMFESGFKESSQNSVNLSYSSECLKNLVQFVYTGQMDSHTLTPDVLLELLSIAHMTEIKDLFDYCVDLINEKFDQIPSSLIPSVIQTAYLYDVNEFLVPCLKSAENFEELNKSNLGSESSQSINWQAISKSYYADLLAIAAKNNLKNVEQKLINAISQSLKN